MVGNKVALGSKPPLNHSGKAEPRGASFSGTSRRGDGFLGHVSPTLTAVLVDADFFVRRARRIFGPLTPTEAAERLHRVALDHLGDGRRGRTARLYRIFVYDAPPAQWKGHYPLSKRSVNVGKSDLSVWRNDFHDALRGMRKVALRLGEVPINQVRWQLKPGALKELVNGGRAWADLTDDDFRLDLRQKGVDMRLGLDIASLAYKRQVTQIVLVSGDADFVPAAKLARREGIDFVLDPMWAAIRPDLNEHIDGLRSVCPRPGGRGVATEAEAEPAE